MRKPPADQLVELVQVASPDAGEWGRRPDGQRPDGQRPDGHRPFGHRPRDGIVPDREGEVGADRLDVGGRARLALAATTALARWDWWQGIGPRARATMIACVALTAAGLAFGVSRVVTTPHAATPHAATPHAATPHAAMPPGAAPHVGGDSRRVETGLPQGADAFGCPAGHTCRVEEVGFTLPGVVPFRVARVIAATDTAEESTTAVYRRELVLTTNGPAGVLRIVSQCLPEPQPYPQLYAQLYGGAGASESHNVDPATGSAFLELTYRVFQDRRCSTLVQFSGPDDVPAADVHRIRAALPQLAADPPLRAHL